MSENASLTEALAEALSPFDTAQRDLILQKVATDAPGGVVAAGLLIKGSRNKEIIPPLMRIGNQIEDAAVVYALGLAISGIGGTQARHAATELAQRLHPYDRLGLEWHATGLTPSKAIHRFITSNLAPTAQATAALETPDPPAGHIYDLAEVLGRLHQAGIVQMFRLLPTQYPPPHDALFVKMIKLTRGMLTASAVAQTATTIDPQTQTGTAKLRFVVANKPRMLELKFEHGQYDVDTLVTGINNLFRIMQVRHRLMPLLAPHGYTALVFGEAKEVLLCLEDVHIPIDPDKVILWRRSGVNPLDPGHKSE